MATSIKVETPTVPTSVYVANGIGILAGLGFAFYKKKGFWGYVGFGILGGITGTMLLSVIHKVIKPKK